MEQLTHQEKAILGELARLAGPDKVVNGIELRDAGFADFIAKEYHSNVAYPGSLQSRTLQILRNKGYIEMERKRGGIYTIIKLPDDKSGL